MRSAVLGLCLALSGCVGGVRLAGDAEQSDAQDTVTVDVPVPPPAVSPPWCPAAAASRPCRPVERALFAAQGKLAALTFVDDGALALVGRLESGTYAGSVDLLHLGIDGSLERRVVVPLGAELFAVWIGDGFAAVIPEHGDVPSTFLRLLPDGTVAWSATGDWYCEQLTWTGVDLRCLTVTTRDMSWSTLDPDGRVADAHDYAVDGFLRTGAWSPFGPGLLYTAGHDAGDSFLHLDPAGAVAAGPMTIDRDTFADMLLAAGPTDFVVLGFIDAWDSPLWAGVDVVVTRLDPDGTMRRRPIIVDHIRANTHVPSWGPTYFDVAPGTDDMVVAYRDIEPSTTESVPAIAHPLFRVVTNDGLIGERNELASSDDDDWLDEWFLLARAGTGLAVARSHSGSAGPAPALDIWLGCCE